MILRDVILSSEPLALEAQRRVVLEAYASDMLVPTAPSAPPLPPPLSIERVATWLETCTDAERRAVVSALAPDIAQLRDEAQQRGFDAGQAQALEEAHTRTRSALEALDTMTRAANDAFESEAAQLAKQCAEIVSESFAKIAGTPLAAPEAVLGTVGEVLRRVKEEQEVVIRVSAADLPVLQSLEPALARILAGRKCSLLADPRVELGGCIVESQLGSLDGRLEIQLRALYETIRATKLAHEEAP